MLPIDGSPNKEYRAVYKRVTATNLGGVGRLFLFYCNDIASRKYTPTVMMTVKDIIANEVKKARTNLSVTA